MKWKAMLWIAAGLLATQTAAAKIPGSLYEELSSRPSVKVFVNTPSDATGEGQINPAALKAALEKGLSGRKSISFDVVSSPAEAEYVIETEVLEFFWSETDPVDMFLGAGPLVMDAASQDHYAQMTAKFRIKDTAKDKWIWEDRLRGSVTDGEMKEEDSLEMVNARMAKVFIREAFSRKRDRRR